MTGRPNEVEQTGSGNNYAVALVVALFAAITIVLALVDDPRAAVATLYVLPIAIVAVRWGTRWALAAAV
ncbi:MAG: hypothetical protein M3O25_09580, partial [Actinomycetota bacterium]|nr:hypothetical protein [Actinomycetota bacterium]